ncbi:MAG: hypothetical protein K6G16_04925 [Lachnospiraceae bacterium]|nr:hypothetical protein [Lachnospiraceae bacterium]
MAKPKSIQELIQTLSILSNDLTKSYEMALALQVFVDDGMAFLDKDASEEDRKKTALYGLQLNDLTAEKLYSNMYDLLEQFVNGTGGHDWKGRAQVLLENAANMLTLADDSKFPEGCPADLFAQGFDDDRFWARADLMNQLLQVDPRVTDSIRRDIEEATTYDEFVEIMSAMRDTFRPLNNSSRIIASDFIDEADRLLHDDDVPQSDPDARLYRGLVTDPCVREVRKKLYRACAMMELNEQLTPDLFQPYQDSMEEKREGRSRDVLKALADKVQAEHMKEVLPKIQEMQLKMKEGDAWWHVNSADYRHMKCAVDEVCRLGKNYDPKSRNSVIRMQKAMDHLNQMADIYVKNKVYGKQKSTDMGIARKNAALALLELTHDTRSDKETEVDLDRIRDWRSVKSDTGKTKVALGRDGLKTLVDAELNANHDRSETRKREAQAKQDKIEKAAKERREKGQKKAAAKQAQKPVQTEDL